MVYFLYFFQLSMQKYQGVLNGWLWTLKWIALFQEQLLFVLVTENIFNGELETDVQDDLDKVEDKVM